ncbi:MAG: hypothetical protein V7K64_29875 [Nostoc sp.]
MLKTLYIVRHCQAVGQEPNAPLTSEGHLQAIALTDLTLFCHSPKTFAIS